jgi:hypothetical protein
VIFENTDLTISDVLARINEQVDCRFIIIIDEWDCLFRDDKEDFKVQQRYINLLRTLFKDNRSKKFTALAYITGILPIKKYNSESALNNFREYTMLEPAKLAKYIGFTADEVKALCEEHHMDYEQAMEWYDGYSFEREKHICGPNSVVCAMLDEHYDNYWSQTVAFNSLKSYITMNYDGLKDAIKMLLGGQRVSVKVRSYANDMTSFDSKDDVLTVLIHLGYLAYDAARQEAYIPNKEVRQIFEWTMERTGWDELIKTIDESENLLEATIGGDEEAVARAVDECHDRNASIIDYNNENALASVIMLAYYSARKDYMIIRELPAGKGFADMVFIPKRNVDKPALVVELKWKKDADTALKQIRDKQYTKALEGYCGEILLVGISYDQKDKGTGENREHACRIERCVKG